MKKESRSENWAGELGGVGGEGMIPLALDKDDLKEEGKRRGGRGRKEEERERGRKQGEGTQGERERKRERKKERERERERERTIKNHSGVFKI